MYDAMNGLNDSNGSSDLNDSNGSNYLNGSNDSNDLNDSNACRCCDDIVDYYDLDDFPCYCCHDSNPLTFPIWYQYAIQNYGRTVPFAREKKNNIRRLNIVAI